MELKYRGKDRKEDQDNGKEKVVMSTDLGNNYRLILVPRLVQLRLMEK